MSYGNYTNFWNDIQVNNTSFTDDELRKQMSLKSPGRINLFKGASALHTISLGYIKFKRELAKSNKKLNFDKENIKIIQNDKTGAIVATGVLTIVGLTDEFF